MAVPPSPDTRSPERRAAFEVRAHFEDETRLRDRKLHPALAAAGA